MHDERIVVNASPLILLTKIDAAPLLKEIASEIAVPAAVRAEVEAGALDPARVPAGSRWQLSSACHRAFREPAVGFGYEGWGEDDTVL